MPGIIGLRYNYRYGGDTMGGPNDKSNDGGGGGREDAQSQYGGAYNVGYRSQDNRSGREQVYGPGAGAETTPVTEVDLLETFKPKEAGGLFPSYTPPRNIQQAFNIISTPRTVADVRNPFTDLTKDVLNPDDDTQVDSLTGEDDEGIMGLIAKISPIQNIAKILGFTGDAKNIKGNTELGGECITSVYTGLPALRPTTPIVEEEEVVDPRTAEMEAFRAILRRNLGLI